MQFYVICSLLYNPVYNILCSDVKKENFFKNTTVKIETEDEMFNPISGLKQWYQNKFMYKKLIIYLNYTLMMIEILILKY